MASLRGFWSERPRQGQDDADLIAAAHVHALRQVPYAELRRRAETGDSTVDEVTGLSGARFQRRTDVQRHDRRDGEQVRILVQVDDGTSAGRLQPLAEDLLIATPDGTTVGGYALVGAGDDSGRPELPAWIAVVVGVAGVVLLAAFLLLA